jgi:hypothetical protein
VPDNLRFLVPVQGVRSIAKDDSSIESPPIAMTTPAFAFLRMAKDGPANQHLVHRPADPIEDFLGHTNAIVVGPTPDNPVQRRNQASLGTASIAADHLSELGHVPLNGLLTGFDENLETGLTPVGARPILAYPILSDVEAQEIKAYPSFVLLEGVSNPGFLRFETQPPRR